VKRPYTSVQVERETLARIHELRQQLEESTGKNWSNGAVVHAAIVLLLRNAKASAA